MRDSLYPLSRGCESGREGAEEQEDREELLQGGAAIAMLVMQPSSVSEMVFDFVMLSQFVFVR